MVLLPLAEIVLWHVILQRILACSTSTPGPSTIWSSVTLHIKWCFNISDIFDTSPTPDIEYFASWLELIFSCEVVKTDLSSPSMFMSVWDVFGMESCTYSAANNRVICEESVNDIFTIIELGRSAFIRACISVYHVKHLHLIEFQMLSGIVMKPCSHCYGNFSWKGGGYMVSPQNPLHNILMFVFMLCMVFVVFHEKNVTFRSV